MAYLARRDSVLCWESRGVLELPLIAERQVRWQFAVAGSNATDPARRAFRVIVRTPDEVDIERLRLMNVAGPKQPDVIVFERVAAGDTFECQLDDPIGQQLIALATFKAPMWRRRLVELLSLIHI